MCRVLASFLTIAMYTDRTATSSPLTNLHDLRGNRGPKSMRLIKKEWYSYHQKIAAFVVIPLSAVR